MKRFVFLKSILLFVGLNLLSLPSQALFLHHTTLDYVTPTLPEYCPSAPVVNLFKIDKVTEYDLGRQNISGTSRDAILITPFNSGQFIYAALQTLPQDIVNVDIDVDFQLVNRPLSFSSRDIELVREAVGVNALDPIENFGKSCLSSELLTYLGLSFDPDTGDLASRVGYDYYYAEVYAKNKRGLLLIVVDQNQKLVYTHSRFT